MVLFELRRCVGAMEDQWSYELGRCVYVLPCKGAQDQHIRRCTKESMTSLKKHKSTRSRSIGYRILTSYKTQYNTCRKHITILVNIHYEILNITTRHLRT